jgi:hypothetical protein
VNIYTIANTFYLEDSPGKGALTMQAGNVKLIKSVENTVNFQVKNKDRKPIQIDNVSVYANIVSNSGTLIKNVQCTKHISTKGSFDLVTAASDFEHIDPGMYRLSFYTQDTVGTKKPLFTNLAGTGNLNVEIEDSIIVSPVDSISTSTFIETGTSTGIFDSEPIRVYDAADKHGLITFVTYLDNYFGQVSVFGTLDDTYTMSSSWFAVPLGAVTNYVDYTSATTKLDPFNLTLAVKYIKFRHVPNVSNTGSITKILIRA